MKKAKTSSKNREMRAEYDFSRGVRGKYATQYRAGTNVVLLGKVPAEMIKRPDDSARDEAEATDRRGGTEWRRSGRRHR